MTKEDRQNMYLIAMEVMDEFFESSAEVVKTHSMENMTKLELIEYYDLAMVMVSAQRMQIEILKAYKSLTDSQP